MIREQVDALDRAVAFNKEHEQTDKKKFTKKIKSDPLKQTIEYIRYSDYRLLGEFWSRE